MFEDLIECLKHMRTSCILTESKIKIYCVVIIWFVMNLRTCSILNSIFINSVITKNGNGKIGKYTGLIREGEPLLCERESKMCFQPATI